MCGIVGYYGVPKTSEPKPTLLNQMIEAIRHRGPDEQNLWCLDHMGLGHARLSIIDLVSGKQPMSNPDETIWLSFNGEIFNHIELRQDLEARGHVFRTNSDTEVILHLYQEKGLDCVEELNGDFAFAIMDKRKNQLMLARDRMGVRPLYYTENQDCLYFASEVKSLLTVPGIEAELDPIALDQIFTFWFPLAPRTPFKDIYELPPGHIMTVTPAGRKIKRYWQLSYPEANDIAGHFKQDEQDIAEELKALLFDATKIRLRADVPVGAYLSGGLDSSIITAAVKQIAPGRLRSFSVTFDDAEFDERQFQQQMVAALGTRHTEICCRTHAIGNVFPEVIRHTERPILRTAPSPLFKLSELVHGHNFKVVLTGEGADEVFAGYDIFKEAKLRRFCAAQPDSQMRPQLLRRLYPYLPQMQNQTPAMLANFFNGESDLDDPLYSHMPRFRSTSGAKIFFSEDLRRELADYNSLADLRDQLPDEFSNWHPLSQAQYLETAYLLPGYILSSQGDRMSMAHAVEGRYPFLDHRLVEFAARIPPKLKMRALREKHILRESMKDILPRSINDRPKQPYRAPDSASFTGPSAPGYVSDLTSEEVIAEAGYFNPKAAQKLVKKCQRNRKPGTRDNVAFVGIVSTQLWHQEFINQSRTTTHDHPELVVA